MIDAYFSATKVRWLLDDVDGARAQAERGERAFAPSTAAARTHTDVALAL